MITRIIKKIFRELKGSHSGKTTIVPWPLPRRGLETRGSGYPVTITHCSDEYAHGYVDIDGKKITAVWRRIQSASTKEHALLLGSKGKISAWDVVYNP